MSKMRKVNPNVCKQCCHHWYLGVNVACRYILDTGHSRNCEYGECDKFEAIKVDENGKSNKIEWDDERMRYFR